MTRPSIKLLDEKTINQINAGEVIEGPSSVVKELVENAIDAGATSIRVELLSGGRQRIRVSDNGYGIPHEEVPLAFARHATSKITSHDDLMLLDTLGFRGEALPSISSVSKIEFLTSIGEEKGSLYLSEGGKVTLFEEAFRDRGTTFDVKDLFFNVPVRKKFLRSPGSLTQDILKLIKQFTFAYPHIGFTLVADEKIILEVIPATQNSLLDRLKQRLVELDPESKLEKWVPIELDEKGIQAKGWLIDPTYHRPNRTEQNLFLNSRVIDPFLIGHAIREGYGPAIPDGRHPAFILHLKLPPQLIDVNVHPQKKEVRLREKSLVYSTLAKGVEGALSPNRTKVFVPPIKMQWEPRDFISPRILEEEKRRDESFEVRLFSPTPVVLFSWKGWIGFLKESAPDLIMDDKEGMAILSLKKGYAKLFEHEKKTTFSQPLFNPIPLHLSSNEKTRLETFLHLWKEAGFDLEPFGSNDYLIRGFPPSVKQEEGVDLVFKWLKGDKKIPSPKEDMLENLSRKKLSLEEGSLLLSSLARLPSPSKDLQGNPLVVVITSDTLGKLC